MKVLLAVLTLAMASSIFASTFTCKRAIEMKNVPGVFHWPKPESNKMEFYTLDSDTHTVFQASFIKGVWKTRTTKYVFKAGNSDSWGEIRFTGNEGKEVVVYPKNSFAIIEGEEGQWLLAHEGKEDILCPEGITSILH